MFRGQPTVHLNLDVANLGDRHMVALHLEGCGGEYQTAKTVAPFESREPGCLVVLDATKESSERSGGDESVRPARYAREHS